LQRNEILIFKKGKFMSFSLVTSKVQIQRHALALYNLQLGGTMLNQFDPQPGSAANALDNLFNSVYSGSVRQTAPVDVASELVKNVGIVVGSNGSGFTASQVADAVNYVTGQLAAVSYDKRGAVVQQILNDFAILAGTNNVYAVAATAWNASVDNAIVYANNNAANAAPGTAGSAVFNLSINADSWTGSAANDTFIATGSAVVGVSALDKIDGGAGDDVLNITATDYALIDSTSTVKNIETLNVVSVRELYTGAADVSGWTGLTTANVTISRALWDNTFTSTTGSKVTFTETVANAANITLNGGKTVAATVTNTDNNASKTITVNGDASTETVTVTQTGTAGNNAAAGVAINDLNNGKAGKANTITTVTIDGLTGAAATVKSDALATLNLANSDQNVTVTNTTAKHTLAVNLNKVTGGIIKDDAATTLNITTNGESTDLNLSNKLATTINFAGDAALSAAVTAAALKDVTIAGAGGVTADLSGASVSSVNAAKSTGANTITLDATKATFVGGTGADTLILTTVPTKAVDGGAGTDVLSLAGVLDLTTVTSKALSNASNFEVLGLTGGYGATKGTLDLSALTGFTGVQIDSSTAGADLVLANASASTSLTVLQVTGKAITANLKADGSSDTLALTLGNAKSFAALDFTGGKNDITANGQDTVSLIANADTSEAAVQHKVVLSLDSAATLNLSGAAGVDFTGSTFTKLATVNSTSAGDVNIALTLDGATSVTTGAGADTIRTGATTKAATINAGDGNNSVTTFGGNDSITTGKGNDTIIAGEGNNTVISGDGKNTIIVGNGNNTITAGAGDDQVSVGSGTNTVTLGAGSDTLIITVVNTDRSNFTTIKDLTVGDKIQINPSFFANATGKLGAALSSGVSDYGTFLSAGAAKGAGQLSWFQWSGDTYLVQDNSVGNAFVDGSDLVVKITGSVDLSNSTLVNNDHILTIA
jgi:S-layer protein